MDKLDMILEKLNKLETGQEEMKKDIKDLRSEQRKIQKDIKSIVKYFDEDAAK
ncbi:hypothetical protein LPY66_19245 [Dehalobacter sp. DCM]|uniref:hypothetical protein n=1 Tax=Dehalobacter sp. DCM TaxID=2907827 RepID=UPI0030816B96|nr:hypothetical protein LPY66_19245 [Dehalobacter sp. DCM]